MNHVFPVYLALVNIVAFHFYRIDKQRARKGQWRIREDQLIMLAMIGGGIGALLAMRLFHHKTRHVKFTVLVPLFTLAWCFFAYMLYF